MELVTYLLTYINKCYLVWELKCIWNMESLIAAGAIVP